MTHQSTSIRPFIPQMRPWFSEEEKRAVCSYMDEDGFITEFKRTERFEQMIAEYTRSKHCIVVNNGTISLTLAAIAVGITHGDEVIVPNYTMIATPNSVKMIGALPVFVDVEPETLCLDIAKTREAITPRTRAIMLVTANGRYPKAGIAAFENLACEKGLILLEDAAQSMGSFFPDGRHMGTAGLIGSFSFSMPKIISTGQGGCLVTNDDDVAAKLRRLKDFGRARGGIDIHDSIGYNFKFTELQACLGIEQMKKLPERVELKKKLALRYRSNLQGVDGIKLFEQDLSCTAPWFFDAIVEKRADLIEYLKSNQVGTRTMYPPINQQRAYGLSGSYPVSERVGERGLWLPSATQLTNDDVDYITDRIRAFYR